MGPGSIPPAPIDLDALLEQAVREQGAGRLNEAAAAYRQILAARPDFAQGHNNLGNLLALQNQMAEAASHFERAIALDPNHALAHYNLGKVLLHLGQFEQALGGSSTPSPCGRTSPSCNTPWRAVICSPKITSAAGLNSNGGCGCPAPEPIRTYRAGEGNPCRAGACSCSPKGDWGIRSISFAMPASSRCAGARRIGRSAITSSALALVSGRRRTGKLGRNG